MIGKVTTFFMTLGVIFVLVTTLLAYEGPTHRALTYRSLRHRQSSVDDFLKGDLIWPSGIEKNAKTNITGNACFGNCSLATWLELGAVDEDVAQRKK